MKAELSTFFDQVLPAIDALLDTLLPPASTEPARIHEAVRYSVFAGGKRLRPALCIASFSLYHDDYEPVLPVACVFEMIHTYSLIHDDLPAMDDDDFRRGIPSCHKKFGEAIAILAGDALVTLAFETLARCRSFPADRMLSAVAMIGHAAGTPSGMIAGQVFDLEAEGRRRQDANVEQIHRAKTAALITAAVTTGAYLGGASEWEQDVVRTFGQRIGLAFQIVDDILDETVPSDQLGKTPGKDRNQQKATYPAVYGLDRSREIVSELTKEARVILARLGSRGQTLGLIADYLENRSH